MKIFFSASIHGKKQFEDRYRKIIELIEAEGHTVVADHVLNATEQEVKDRLPREDEKFYQKILDGIKHSDAMVAELSYSSTSVGYFLAVAVNLNKPVVIFYSGQEEPHLFKTLDAVNDKLVVVRYHQTDELKREVPLMMDFINEVQDTRFNFFVSPNIASYLDWVSRNKRVPRSVYLRRLIEADMQHNDNYQA